MYASCPLPSPPTARFGRISRRLPAPSFLFLFALLALGLFFATRLSLALFSGVDALPLAYWPGAFLRGLWFDLLTLAVLLAPLWLLRTLCPERLRAGRLYGPLRLLLFFAAAFALFFGAVAEWTFWEEFQTRFNFIAVDYLVYTQEVIGNILESYPVVNIVAALAALAAFLTWGLRRQLVRAPQSARSYRLAQAGLALLLPVVVYTLADIDHMQHADNEFANELAGNGLMTFAAAFRRNELDYERFYRTLPADEGQQILRALRASGADLQPAGNGGGPRSLLLRRPKNVVLISVESLSAKYLGAFGNRDGLTPNLDRLASEGLLLSRLYATGTRTVRGLEALSLGTPPIPGQSIVRRPGNEHLSTIGGLLRAAGFDSLFVYGGYGYFDNMNAYFAGNGYRVIDRADFPDASVNFANAWGVADEALFANTLSELDRVHAAGKPFFTHVMTTSNHRPFTYPAGRIDIPSPGKRPGAVKYTDFAIGQFIDAARGKPWFAETLFVITADHCASAAGKTRLPVEGYRIPAIFYGPQIIRPGRDDRLLSQIDIPPTLLDMLGQSGEARFFGKSIFRQNAAEARTLISNYQELGYLRHDVLTVLGPRRRAEAFRIDPLSGEATPMALDPALLGEGIAYYQQASRAFKSGQLKLPAAIGS
jgi:phosphoglycerol transferase MdoB-like AlkP superfamily enzyme